MVHEQILQYCRLCKSNKIQLVFKKGDIFIFRCFDCGVVFLGNILKDESIKELYQYYKNNPLANYLSPVTKLRYKKLLASLGKHRKNNSIIDVGCGAGYFMLAALENKWNVDGIEISHEAIKLAEEKGLKVIRGDAALLDIEKEKYDVATLFEIIEHASNPEGIISKLSSILRPGGVLYLTTPNYNSIARKLLGSKWDIFHKEHTFYFTIKDLILLLNRHGFVIKKTMTKNLSLREILSIFRRVKPADNSAVFEAQERIRSLSETKGIFFILKSLINFILNIFKTGETIYILAEKQTV